MRLQSIPTFHDNPSFCASCWQPSARTRRQDRHGLDAHGTLSDHRCPAAPPAPIDVPEIAFVGRSNAGKSTCINTLTQQKQLAFCLLKKPGRTQHINLFALGKQGVTDAVLADLPGYGYAAVSRSTSCAGSR